MHNLKTIWIWLMVLSALICFVGCNGTPSSTSVETPQNTISNKSEKTNYNNIYTYAYSPFWVDKNSIYYGKSGLFNTRFYCMDENGKQIIASNSAFAALEKGDANGQIYDMQAYGDDVYLLYQNDEGVSTFYLYAKKDETYKMVFSTKENVNDWAVVNNVLVFSTFLEDKDVDVNSLWLYRMDEGTTKRICIETTAFGIVNNEIRYVKRGVSEKNVVYRIHLDSLTSEFICSFDYRNDIYNAFNFTEKYLTFFQNGLSVLNLENGDVKNYLLPKDAKFMSCYEDFAFVCSKDSVYRVCLTDGEMKLVTDGLQECNLIYAINDEQAVILCYEDASSLFASVKVYQVGIDGSLIEITRI